MKRYMLPALLFILVASGAHAAAKHVPTFSCGDTMYWPYKPHVPHSLDEVAPPALSRLQAHLQARLGDEMAAKLKFAGGQIVDRERLLRDNPNSIDYQWRAPKYALKFMFPIPAGQEEFCASIELDDDGTIMSGITLPDFRAHPERRSVATAAVAKAFARSNGVPEHAKGELYYFRDSDTLEWVFTFVTSSDGHTIEFSHFHLPAHDTFRVHWSESTGIR